LRTTNVRGDSSSTVGGVIQFKGLTLDPPPSAHTMKVPSALIMSRRTASGRWVESRPVYATEQRATIRRTRATLVGGADRVRG
jgi:hypothetical protein